MYIIKRNYEKQPCKNRIDGRYKTLKSAVTELDINQKLWRKHGGTVVSRKTKRELVCRESDDSEIITWTITKTN